MKLKLSQLRKIIREVVETELTGTEEPVLDPQLLKQLEDEVFRLWGRSWKDREPSPLNSPELKVYDLIAKLKDQGMTVSDLEALESRVKSRVSADPYKGKLQGVDSLSPLGKFIRYFNTITSKPRGPFEYPSIIGR